MEQLHALYPHALLGFGEVGLPHRARPRTLAEASAVMSWAYGLEPRVPDYVGGYFWWYAREDAFVGTAPLAGALVRAFHCRAGCPRGAAGPRPAPRGLARPG